MKQWIVCGLTAVAMAGCGGSGDEASPMPPPSPTAVVFISPPPASMAVDAAATLSAAATFSTGAIGGNTTVTWTVTCSSAGACGAFSGNDEAGAVTYTAPSAIPSGKTVKVTATSAVNPGVSASSTVTIVAPIPISAVPGGGGASVSGFADAGADEADFAVSGSANSAPNGIAHASLTGLDPASLETPGSFTLYVVDSTRAVLIETDGAGLALGDLQNGP